jgi:hypothetical protein
MTKMTRNRTRDQRSPGETRADALDAIGADALGLDEKDLVSITSELRDQVTSDPESADTGDQVTSDPDTSGDADTGDTSGDDDPDTSGDDDPDQVDEKDLLSDDEKRAALVASLKSAWHAAAESSDTGTVPAAELVPTFSAFSALSALVTRPTERAAIVATIAADLSAEFIAAGNVLPALAVHSVRAELDKKTQKVALVIDPTRDNATRYLVATLAFLSIAEKATDDEKAMAATIPTDDPAFSAMAEKVMSALTKKASARGTSTSTSTGPRKTAESLDTVLLSIAAGETVALSKVAKDSDRSPGALTNAHAAMVAGTRVIPGVRAVVTSDGKKAFTRDA